jgi:hypothetical protein
LAFLANSSFAWNGSLRTGWNFVGMMGCGKLIGQFLNCGIEPIRGFATAASVTAQSMLTL